MNDLSDRFEHRVRAIAAALIEEAMDRLVEQVLAPSPAGRRPPPRTAGRRTRSYAVRAPVERAVVELEKDLVEDSTSKPRRSGKPSRDPLILARRQHGPCMVYRCLQPHAADGYCAAHRAEADVEGWPVPPPRSFRPPFKAVPLPPRLPDATPPEGE